MHLDAGLLFLTRLFAFAGAGFTVGCVIAFVLLRAHPKSRAK